MTNLTINIECNIENKFDINDIKKNIKDLMAGVIMYTNEDNKKIGKAQIYMFSCSLLLTIIFAILGFILCKDSLSENFIVTGIILLTLIIVCILLTSLCMEKKFSDALHRRLKADLEKADTLEEILTVTKTLQKSFVFYKRKSQFEYDIFNLSMLNERIEDYLTLIKNPILHTQLIGNTLCFDIKNDNNFVIKKKINTNLVEKVDATGYNLQFENWETPTLVCRYDTPLC